MAKHKIVDAITGTDGGYYDDATGALVLPALTTLPTQDASLTTLDGQRIKKVSKTIAYTQLTDADGSQTFAFASALPASAVVVGAQINVATAFTDGAAGVFTADVGVNAGDIDAFIDGASLAAIARVGAPLGVSPCGFQGAITPAITMLATVNLNTATAGSLTCEVYYFEAANL